MAILVYGLLDHGEQFGSLLNLIQNDPVCPRPQAAGILLGLAQSIEIIHGVAAPCRKGSGIPKQGALSHLAGTREDDHGMVTDRLAKFAGQPALVI